MENDYINDNSLFDEAKYIYERGTDRSVIAGNKNKYQWVEKVHPFKYLS